METKPLFPLQREGNPPETLFPMSHVPSLKHYNAYHNLFLFLIPFIIPFLLLILFLMHLQQKLLLIEL